MFNATANPLTNGYMKNPETGASHIKQAIISTNIETIVNAIEILFCFVIANFFFHSYLSHLQFRPYIISFYERFSTILCITFFVVL